MYVLSVLPELKGFSLISKFEVSRIEDRITTRNFRNSPEGYSNFTHYEEVKRSVRMESFETKAQ